MTPRARWGALALLVAPLGAWALGLGDIELRSALNQPLQADIELVSATPEEVAGLRVALAARETFERYGIDRPAFLNGLQFQVMTNAQGRNVVRVTSQQSVTEPFLTMLVEATWGRGRLLREYTVLLDPPVLLPGPAVTEAVQPVQSRVPEPTQPAAPIQRPAPQQAAPAPAAPPPQQAAPAPPQAAPQPVTPAPQPAPAPTPAPAPAAAQAPAGAYGPVQRGETLWGIATRFRPAGVTMNQMMVATFQANPQAFDGNMNILLQGATLRVPDLAAVSRLAATDATAEALRQTAEWEGRATQQARLRLVPPTDQGAPAAGAASTDASADAAIAALEGEVDALQGELEDSRRLLQLRDEQLRELQARLEAIDAAAEAPPELAGEVPVVEPGVDLESEELFADEAAAVPDPAQVAEPEEVVEPEAPQPPVVVPPAATQVVTTQPQPSLVSRIIDGATNPIVLIGLGLLALLGTAAWYLRHRQDAEDDVTGRWEALEAEIDEDLEGREATERMRRQVPAEDESFVVVEQSPAKPTAELAPVSLLDEDDLDDFRPPETESPSAAASLGSSRKEAVAEDTLSSQTVINLDQADAVAEADFHMAYGLYDQAAELVTKALAASPDRRDLKLKLLEVYFVWGNKESFLDAAQGMRREIGDRPDPDWDKVVIMGKQICPDEALFTDATAGVAAEVDVDLDAGESPALDFAFDDSGGSDLDLDVGDLGQQDVELELESTREHVGDRAFDEDDALDIGDRTAAGLEVALLGEPSDASAATTPNLDTDSSAVTQESPTIESPLAPTVEGPLADFTAESPTIETEAADAPTVETPTLETAGPDAPTMETPTLETPGSDDWLGSPRVETSLEGTGELPTVEQPALREDSGETGERTAEIDLDDLGLDIKDLEDLPTGLGEFSLTEDDESDAADESALTADDDLLSATGVTQVLQEDDLEHISTSVIGDEEATLLAPGFDEDTFTGTDVLSQPEFEESGETSILRALRAPAAGGSGLDLDLDDLSAALDDGETVEQPSRSFSSQVFGRAGPTGVDLDVGTETRDADEEPTASEETASLDAQTMTEVGTKLDLARAYIDMGDPDGARSILEEVMDEGDPGQQKEAKSLIAAL